MAESRPYTKEEVREQFLSHIRHLVQHWKNTDAEDKLDGLAFSILVAIDGSSMALPSFDIVVRPHPDDQAFCEQNGDNYHTDGMVINDDVHLHDLYYNRQ